MALPAKKTAAKKAPAPKAEKAEKAKKPGVGDFVKQQILAGKDNDKIIELVLSKFPDANTTKASVNWYRSKLRAEGEEVPSSRQPKAAKPAAVKKSVAPKVAGKKAKGGLLKKSKPAASAEGEGGF